MQNLKDLKASFDKAKDKIKQASSKNTTLKLKGYHELKRLGKGSFGYAMLVERGQSKDLFVSKMVKYRHMSTADKEYVLREVQTMTHISNGGGHPYLVRFRESFVISSGPLCIIMDYCDGGDLAQLIKSAARKRTPFS
jgi:NIMA (never in mitosis gene a)-related kinase